MLNLLLVEAAAFTSAPNWPIKVKMSNTDLMSYQLVSQIMCVCGSKVLQNNEVPYCDTQLSNTALFVTCY